MKVRRHAILYDTERWRRYRWPMVLLATAFLIATLILPSLQHTRTGTANSGFSSVFAPLSFAGSTIFSDGFEAKGAHFI